MRKFIFILGILAAFLVYQKASAVKGTVKDAFGLNNVESLADPESGTGGGCYWSPSKCPNGNGDREVCVLGGSGNSCTCGSVTRFC